MARFFGLMGSLVSIYMIIVFFRIILTWFPGMGQNKVTEIVAKITDPYLDWFRRPGIFRLGNLDLSVLVALGVLSLVNRALVTLAFYGTISIGIILGMILEAIWGAASFIIIFMMVVLVLRLIAHLTSRDSYSTIWRVVETISHPVIYRINRFILRDRIINYAVSNLGMELLKPDQLVRGNIVKEITETMTRKNHINYAFIDEYKLHVTVIDNLQN